MLQELEYMPDMSWANPRPPSTGQDIGVHNLYFPPGKVELS